MSSILRSSKFVRYFVGLARNIVISSRPEVDRSQLQRSEHLAGIFSRSFSSNSLNLQGGSTLDRTIRRLDEDARRTGRISFREVEEALNEIRHSKKATTSQSLMVIRCCGNLVPEEAPEHRTQLVEEIWNTLEKLGVALDISHYNALLKVYLENEHKFSPTKFLSKLESQGIEPNRVTYQRLIAGYCQMGDIAGATKILEFMKEKQLPVSEGVFNALILGHSQANDLESAEGMLNVMRQANLEPSNETYMTLLCGYARRGDKETIDRLITECKVKDVLLSDKDFLEVAYTAAINGHDQLVDEVLKNIRHMVGYNQDASNVLLRLITRGKDEAAYKVFSTMQSPIRTESSPNMSGHIIMKQLVKTNRSVEEILSMSERLEKEGHTAFGLWIAVETSFHHGNIELTLRLLTALKQRNEPIRNHYFWPSLVTAGKTGDSNSVLNILKKMVVDFDVIPSSDTLKEYYLPFVESKSPAEILKGLVEAGLPIRPAVVAQVSHLVSQNKLKEAVNLALQFPGLGVRSAFMTRMLVEALQQTRDVHNVVALIHIMASDRSPDREEGEENGLPSDITRRFLTSVVYSGETRRYIADVLKEMLNRGLGISNSCAELVESRLPGDQLTTEISDLLAKLSAGDLLPAALKRTASTIGGIPSGKNVAALQRLKEKMKANNEPVEKITSTVRGIFSCYVFNGDLENALKTKQEWEEDLKQEVPVGMWASLVDLYCSKEDLEGAKQCLEKIKESSTDFEIDLDKALKVAKLLIQNNQLEDAIVLMKEVKPRGGSEGEGGYQCRAAAWQALQAVAETTKDPEQVKKLLKVLTERKFIEINNVFLGSIMKAYLLRDDLEGALKEFEECVKLYRATPWKNELASRLIEKEDAVNLQTLVDLSTQVHGEINSLYDLVLSFVECGRIRQARKILETPGLRSRNTRLNSACERYKNEGQIAPLEGLVEATKDLPHIDRSEIYYNLLESYCQADNVDKAYSLWTQMQDEDVHVSEEFLIKLGSFLKSKGLQVPFEVPRKAEKVKEEKMKEKITPKQTKPVAASNLLTEAFQAKNVDKVLKTKEEIEKKGQQLSQRENTKLMELLVQNDRLREASSLLTSLPEDKLPYSQAVNFLLKKLTNNGEVDTIKRIGDHLPEAYKKLVSFDNKYFTASVRAGKASEELDKLEKGIDSASTPEEVDNMSSLFPRGGIYSILESSPAHHEQVERIVEKYSKKGVTSPANCLCMFYVASGQMDKAREVYQRYNMANSSRIMFRNVLTNARINKNPKAVEDLILLLKDAVSITPVIKGLLYSNLINGYLTLDDNETALSKLEEAVKSVPLENLHTNTLENLKAALQAKNIPFNYSIPPKSAKKSSSSSSSSSSDEERQKLVAAKH